MYTSVSSENINSKKTSNLIFILRVILLFLACILIPMHTILNSRLSNLETSKFIPHYKKMIPIKILESNAFYYFSNAMIIILNTRETALIILGFIYILLSPFIAMKITLVYTLVDFIVVISKILFVQYRPFWTSDTKNDRFCPCDYAFPSQRIAVQIFFYLYLFILLKKKYNNVITFYKCIIIIPIYVALVIVDDFLLLWHKIYFLHQICVSTVLSLIFLSICVDFNGEIDSKIDHMVKNLYKMRKYKIKIFIFILGIFLIGIVFSTFIKEDDLNSIEMNIYAKEHCNSKDEQEVGKKNSLKFTSYIFTFLSAFWGGALTEEHSCGKWWLGSLLNSLIKICVIAIFYGVVLLIFYIIPYLTFEFDFMLQCVKFFIINYAIFGLFPILFKTLNLNEYLFIQGNNRLFYNTIFSLNFNCILKVEENDDLQSDNNNLSPQQLMYSDIHLDNESDHIKVDKDKKFNDKMISQIKKMNEDENADDDYFGIQKK